MMIRVWIVLLVAGLLGPGCGNKDRVPDDVLQPAAMQAILRDMYLADAVNANRHLMDTTLNLLVENKQYFERVFELHGVSRQQFLRSYDYYAGRPDIFRKVTDSLLVEMNRLSTEALTDTIPKLKLNGRNLPDTAATSGN